LHPSFNSINQKTPSLEPNTSPAGLSGEAARSALDRHGPNIFATERAPQVIALLLRALLNPFNAILLVLAIVNIATGDKATFTVMVVMVMASTGLRFVFFFHQKKKT
jgi:Mg2+-importing ATPase